MRYGDLRDWLGIAEGMGELIRGRQLRRRIKQ
jgi:hypothetical protein